MTAEEYLKQYSELNRRAQRYKAEYQTELEKIDAIGSTLAGEPGMPHGTGISRKTEDKAVRLADKATKWITAGLEAIEKRQEIFELIHDIDGIEGDILYERYINLLTWEQIAERLYYSDSGIYYAHQRALDIVERRLSSAGGEDL